MYNTEGLETEIGNAKMDIESRYVIHVPVLPHHD